MSSEDDDDDLMDGGDDAPDAFDNKTPYNGIPANSQAKYNQEYQSFQKWNKSNNWCAISEDLLIKYFVELESKYKPSSMLSIYSMLKSTFRVNDNIDIGLYSKLLEHLKEKNVGYKPAGSKSFTDEEVNKFLNDAPDDMWLDVKVVCIFGISGMWNVKHLLTLIVDHVKRYEDLILLTVPQTMTNSQCTFTVTGSYFDIVQKYADLRPDHSSDRFFLCYKDGMCTAKPIGKHKFNAMPKRIAKFLKLGESHRYSAASFRRNIPNSSMMRTTVSNQFVAPAEKRMDLDFKTGQLKPSSFSYTPTPASSQAPRPNTNRNDCQSEHVCTLSCGQVKCASEQNEESVLHAFTTMKPPEFIITDLTPAVYPSDPACRWIVGYTHRAGEVTTSYADETFEDITRSIPNNVRINQRYIRGNTIHLPAAYVVVYGVNCKCQKETEDLFKFAVNELQFEV